MTFGFDDGLKKHKKSKNIKKKIDKSFIQVYKSQIILQTIILELWWQLSKWIFFFTGYMNRQVWGSDTMVRIAWH